MLKFVLILGWAWFSMAVMGSAPDAAARGYGWLSETPFHSVQHPEHVEIAMERADLSAVLAQAGTDPAVPRPDRDTQKSDAEMVIVGDIRFGTEKSGAEKVCFALNRFCDPQVFSIEGDKPRIVIDIKNVHSWDGKSSMPVDGVLIRQVRTHFHRDQNKLRIVLDLTPSMNYTAEPLYYKAEGIYCIAVGRK